MFRFYDRSALLSVTTHTVLHNLIFGCILVFLIQWTFLGDFRSAVVVGLNIPIALVLRHHFISGFRRECATCFPSVLLILASSWIQR